MLIGTFKKITWLKILNKMSGSGFREIVYLTIWHSSNYIIYKYLKLCY
jgi:hypothetical protein